MTGAKLRRPPLTTPLLRRKGVVLVGVCPDHPRSGRDVDVTLQRVVVSCCRCARRLLTVRGPFSTGAMLR